MVQIHGHQGRVQLRVHLQGLDAVAGRADHLDLGNFVGPFDAAANQVGIIDHQ